MQKYQLTLISLNRKTGPIPVSMTDKSSCPSTCSFKGNGCYAEGGNVNIHWSGMKDGGRTKTLTLEEFCGAIKSLPRNQLWRHNQAGDLPQSELSAGQGTCIHWPSMHKLILANKGKRGFTYTHYPWEKTHPKIEAYPWAAEDNLKVIRKANADGFTVNVSCESPEQADRAMSLGLPAVLVVPEDAPNSWHTPAGNLVKTCPAVLYDNVNCARCGLCQKQQLQGPKGEMRPRHIVAFPAHGAGKGKVTKTIQELRVIR